MTAGKGNMSGLFPKWTNQLPRRILAAALLLAVTAVVGVWYYFTPAFTRVGYRPLQPVAFSHATHGAQTGLDCRYCHDGVERSWYSNLPSSATCMNCHNQVLKDDPRLAPVRESFQSGRPIPWVQVHKLPDFVYFHHAAHVNRGVSCLHCHGQVDQMDEIKHTQPLTMSFCLNCHRNPAPYLRPPTQVYNLAWLPEDATNQAAQALQWANEWGIRPLDTCGVCHR